MPIVEPMTVRRFVLCADDYAISESVSSGILDLIDLGRVTATSCLVTSKHWPAHASALRNRAGQADIGLHLNLIDDKLLHQDSEYRPALSSYLPHKILMLRSVAGLLDTGRIAQEIERQLDRFMESWGAPPDFIDGHLHVHLLPGVRDALLEVYSRRLAGTGCYIRNIDRLLGGRHGWLKTAVILGLGGLQLRSRLNAAEIPHNVRFGGIYGFSARADYPRLMRAWLAVLGPSTLLMCHPSRNGGDDWDPIGLCRQREYGYLRSDGFQADYTNAGALPARFRPTQSVDDARLRT